MGSSHVNFTIRATGRPLLGVRDVGCKELGQGVCGLGSGSLGPGFPQHGGPLRIKGSCNTHIIISGDFFVRKTD